jgi:hypothetical protein
MFLLCEEKQEKRILARSKTQGRLLLFWMVCVCPMGVLYGHMGTIQPQTANIQLACLISGVIFHLPALPVSVSSM